MSKQDIELTSNFHYNERRTISWQKAWCTLESDGTPRSLSNVRMKSIQIKETIFYVTKSRSRYSSKQRAKSNFKIKIIEYLSHNHTTVKYFNTWKGVARDQKEANAIENNHITK